MGDVVILKTITRLNIPADRILDAAKEQVESAVILGWTPEGEFYFSSTFPGGPEVLWLLELAKKNLMEVFDDEE